MDDAPLFISGVYLDPSAYVLPPPQTVDPTRQEYFFLAPDLSLFFR